MIDANRPNDLHGGGQRSRWRESQPFEIRRLIVDPLHAISSPGNSLCFLLVFDSVNSSPQSDIVALRVQI